MSEAQQNHNRPHLLLTMAMIVLETIFTFILKHDRVVSLQAKKFIDQNITIKINSYLPYFDFYVKFTEEGILFDSQAPEHAVNLDIRTTLIDLVNVFVFANRRSLKKMRMDGDVNLKDEFRDLALLFSVPKVLSDWKQWLSEPSDEQDIISSKKRIAPLLEKIDQQRSSINHLQVEVKQYKNRLRRIEQKQKQINIGFVLTITILIALFVYNFCLG